VGLPRANIYIYIYIYIPHSLFLSKKVIRKSKMIAARSIVFFSAASFFATAFSSQSYSKSTSMTTTPSSLSSYLDSLDFSNGEIMRPASYGVTGQSYNIPQDSWGSYLVPPPPPQETSPAANAGMVVEEEASEFPFAPASYFGMEQLESKGSRSTADWGTPADASRKLCGDGTFSAGAWYCSEGGWPSPNGKAATEVFYVLEGYGSLDDADGVRHYFGPGDNVIIPKGHTGRWDVNQPIRKVWAVNGTYACIHAYMHT
jgi:uncharacterized cupin superfamily protein